MEYIKAFWDSCGMGILCTILTAIASYLGVCAKKLFQKYFDDKTKKAASRLSSSSTRICTVRRNMIRLLKQSLRC